MISVHFLIDEEQLRRVDDLAGHFGFRDRSDVIRKAVRFFLENSNVVKKVET